MGIALHADFNRDRMRALVGAGLLDLTRAQQKLVGALVEAPGTLTYQQLADAMDYQGAHIASIVQVQICKIRKATGLPVVIERSMGARWDG
jgi:DNA-binding response OmpR family regulator